MTIPRLEPGFESGKMADFLRQHEPNFKEIRSKMPTFFENIRAVQKRRINMYTNKAIHLFILHKAILSQIIVKIKSIFR